jgi:hypothetical protein
VDNLIMVKEVSQTETDIPAQVRQRAKNMASEKE